VLLFEVSAYTGFCDLSRDASIASLTDAASDQEDFVMLKNPDGAVMTCFITNHPCGTFMLQIPSQPAQI